MTVSVRAIRLFSKRYKKVIFDRTLGLSISRRLRRRIWFLLEEFNHSYYYQPDPGDNWREHTHVLQWLPDELCRRYGEEQLVAYVDDEEDARAPTDLKGFVERGYPSQVFDVVELFYGRLQSENQADFQRELNSILDEEESEWRMIDGQLFKIDSQFLEMHVVARSYELLKAEGYEGALDELNQARNELSSGNVKGAIHNACKSVESVLKAVTETDSGNASHLIRQLNEIGFYDGLPEDVARAFGEEVLMVLPFMRNRLGGHGQGIAVVDVPRLYGELAVHLAATFILFIVRRSTEILPRRSEAVDYADEPVPDVPF